jgi:hypothetical protein
MVSLIPTHHPCIDRLWYLYFRKSAERKSRNLQLYKRQVPGLAPMEDFAHIVAALQLQGLPTRILL